MNEFLTKKEVADLVGLSQMRINGAMRAGLLKSHKEPIKEGSKTLRSMFDPKDVTAWREQTKTHSRREDGRNKFTIYATVEELDRVTKILKENEIETPIVRSNKVKTTE